MDSLFKLTIGRGFDFTIFSNRFLAWYMFIATIILFLYSLFFITNDLMSLQTYTWTLSALFMIFISWAIAREYHPAEHLTSIISVLLTTILILNQPASFSAPYLLILLLLLSSRVLSRVTSYRRSNGDYLLIALLSILGAYFYQSWLYLLLPSVAFLIDASIDTEERRSFGVGSLLALVSFYFVYSSEVFRFTPELNLLSTYLISGLFLLNLLVISVLRSEPKIKDDKGEVLISASRVLWNRLFLLLAALFLFFFVSSEGYWIALPFISLLPSFLIVKLFNR